MLLKIFVCLIPLLCLFIGAFVYLRPVLTIELQKKFYAMINWRMEPISLEKEIRNTKAMGLFLMVFVVVALFYVAFRK